MDLEYCPVFSNLQTVLLNEWVAIDLNALVCILRHSPILEKLTLQLYEDKDLVSATGVDGNHDPIEQSFVCPCLKVVNIECQEIHEIVRRVLKISSTCGVLPEHISLKTRRSYLYRFSSEKPTSSTSDDDATPSSTEDDD